MIAKEETTILAMEIEQISTVEDVKEFQNILYELIKYDSWRIIPDKTFNPVFIFYHKAMVLAYEDNFDNAKNEIYKAIQEIFRIIIKHLEETFQNFYNRCSTEDITLDENKKYHDRLSDLHKLVEISSLKDFRKKYTKLP